MCTKIACKGNDGSKPKMIQPAAAGASKTKVKRRRLFREESFSCSSSEDDDEDNDDEDIESEDEDDEKDEPMEVVPTVEERGHQNYIYCKSCCEEAAGGLEATFTTHKRR